MDASVVAGREDVLVRICSFDTLFIFQTSLITPHSSLSLLLYRTFMSQVEVEGAVVCLRLCHGKIQFKLLPTAVVVEWYRQRYVDTHTSSWWLLIITSLSPILFLQNSELVEDDANGEVESGDDGLEQLSPKSWIQKILGSARMGGISGPLVREFYSPECRCCAMLIAIVPILMLCRYSMSLSLYS